MATVRDPVCGMDIDPEMAVAREEYRGKTYYFCATSCRIDHLLGETSAVDVAAGTSRGTFFVLAGTALGVSLAFCRLLTAWLSATDPPLCSLCSYSLVAGRFTVSEGT